MLFRSLKEFLGRDQPTVITVSLSCYRYNYVVNLVMTGFFPLKSDQCQCKNKMDSNEYIRTWTIGIYELNLNPTLYNRILDMPLPVCIGKGILNFITRVLLKQCLGPNLS